MRTQRLPAIQRPLFSLNPEGSDAPEPKKAKFSYHKALSDLKDVSKKVSAIKNRLNLLIFKQLQSQNPISAYYQDRQIRLRTVINEEQQKLLEELSVKRLKSQSQLQLKRKSNDIHKRQTMERIDRAKRRVFEQKSRCHEQIREKSRQNSKVICDFKQSFLVQKRSRRHLLYNNQKRHKGFAEHIHYIKIQEIRTKCEFETKRICDKIEQKEKEFRTIQEKCYDLEKNYRQRVTKPRERKFQKTSKRKLITIETISSIDINKENSISPSTSPPSHMSFVIIS